MLTIVLCSTTTPKLTFKSTQTVFQLRKVNRLFISVFHGNQLIQTETRSRFNFISARLTLVPVGPEGQKAKLFLIEHSNWVGKVSDTVSERIVHVCLLVSGRVLVCALNINLMSTFFYCLFCPFKNIDFNKNSRSRFQNKTGQKF